MLDPTPTRPPCEAYRFDTGALMLCRNDAVKRLKLTEYQDALVCLECRDLIRAKSPTVSVNWSNDFARGSNLGALKQG